MSRIAYAFVILDDGLKDQQDLLKHEEDEEHRKEIEMRIEQLKKGIKILKEYEEGAWKS